MTITKITIIACACIALSALVFHGAPNHWIANVTGRLLAPIVQKIGYGRGLAQLLLGGSDILRENNDLRTASQKADVAMARVEALELENAFLRDAAALHAVIPLTFVEAGVFGYLQVGGVRELSANRGQEFGVRVGDTVVTAKGGLVGRVLQVYGGHSVVQMIGDTSYDVTARVMGTDISGLVRTDTRGNVVLDLIQKSEAVIEGQVIITSGNDHVPAGIIIGTIRSVDIQSTTLFKAVYVSPVIEHDYSGSVLIVKQ